MASLNPYLTFQGNCEEAFNRYREIFGGEFTFMGRFGDMPAGEHPMPESDKNLVMHVSLPIGEHTTLMGSDTSANFGPPVTAGSNFSLSVNVDSESEADRVFGELSTGGQEIMPMQNTFWGSYFGQCVDRFGIQWMVSFDPQQS